MPAINRWNSREWDRLKLGLRRYCGSWAAVVKYMVLSPLVNPELTNRFAHQSRAIADELGYRSGSIPPKEVWELFPEIDKTEVTLGRVLPDEGSGVSFRELIILCSLVRYEKAQTIFEIGTSFGVTALNLALNLPENGIVHTLDLPYAQSDQSIDTVHQVSISDRKMIFADRRHRRFRSSRVEGKIHQIFSDSASFEYSPFASQCDMVFVDGAHSLGYVESDTNAALKLARPGGLVLWHDFNNGFFWPDVHKYLTRIADSYRISRIRGTALAVHRKAVQPSPGQRLEPSRIYQQDYQPAI